MPPTRRELGQRLGVCAQTADFHLRALARKGYLELGRQARGVRAAPRAVSSGSRAAPRLAATARPAPEVVAQVPLLGRVAAGRPIEALEHAEAQLSVPHGCPADFALRVQGDSMREAGILDGDLVFVQRAAEARDGEIVVAVIGEGEGREATVKRFRRRRDRVVLEAANPDSPDLVVRRGEACALAGRVVGVQRTWK